MKINYKKSLKLITLLMSSLLIASVSASIYYQMFQSGHVTATSYTLQWITGTDSVGLNINGATCSMSSLTAPVGGAKNYTDPVRLNNTEATSRTFNLVVVSVTGNTSDLEYIYVRLYNSTGSLKGTLAVWSGGSQGTQLTDLVIPGNQYWKFEWDIKWGTSSTTSSYVDVSLRVDVTA
jgi:cellobiose-specific phosphotransferase system component IIC